MKENIEENKNYKVNSRKVPALVLFLAILINIFGLQGTMIASAATQETQNVNAEKENAVNQLSVQDTATNTKAVNEKNVLLSLIVQKNKAYAAYNVESLQEDLDNDGAYEYFFLFTKKGTTKQDGINYSADIWFGKNGRVTRVVKWQYILPDTYGFVTLSGNSKYFQYDLSYATDSRTVLLNVKDGKCQEAFSALGSAAFRKGKGDFSVLTTAYDMEYAPADGFSSGHTWKFYYFYQDSKGFHEYGAKQMSRKAFFYYKNAADIIKKIEKDYSIPKKILKTSFLKRSNGMVHVNISTGDKESVSNYYCTYKITKNNKLILEDSGQGVYLKASLKDIAVY